MRYGDFADGLKLDAEQQRTRCPEARLLDITSLSSLTPSFRALSRPPRSAPAAARAYIASGEARAASGADRSQLCALRERV